MQYTDMHCDTLMPFAQRENYSLFSNDMQVDFLKMKEGGAAVQFFAVFFPPRGQFARRGIREMSDGEYFHTLARGFYDELEKRRDMIAPARNTREISANEKSGKMSAVLTVEDGRMADSLEKIEKMRRAGVRAIALTWNHENCFGFPNSRNPRAMKKGLKPFGQEAVRFMEEKGIITDVSHLSDGGFYDVAKALKGPFIASHSNAREVCPHPRNLSDDMIRILREKGGVMGLNFTPSFVDPRPGRQYTPAEGIAAHAKHIAAVGGVDCVGIGSDFDGTFGRQEICDCSEMPLLWDTLAKAGFHESEIEKIAFKNVMRVIGDVMK